VIKSLAGLVMLSLIGTLMIGCTGVPKGLEPVRGFEPDRYLGTWYEIARLDHRFERGLSHISADYQRDGDAIKIVNRGYKAAKGEWKEANGRATFLGESDVASLRVVFQWPFAGGYHVFQLDKENYQWAMVTGPTRGYFWLLSRTPQMDEALREDLLARAADAGFARDKFIIVDHAGTPPEGE